MAPTCSNCGAQEFVWANEVKTGHAGGGLSLRPKGEVPIGTRICKSCGHADLFLHSLDLLRKPHLWMPGEFYPIGAPKPAEATTAPVAPAPPPPPEPMPPAPEPMPPAAPEPELTPAPELAPPSPVAAPGPAEVSAPAASSEEPAKPARSPRRRSARPPAN